MSPNQGPDAGQKQWGGGGAGSSVPPLRSGPRVLSQHTLGFVFGAFCGMEAAELTQLEQFLGTFLPQSERGCRGRVAFPPTLAA